MQDSLQDMAVVFGHAIMSPGLGSAELLLAMLVAFGFILHGIYSVFARGKADGVEWWER